MSFELPLTTPEEIGVSSKTLEKLIKRLDKETPGVHSTIMMRHNKVFLKCWHKPYKEELPHMMYSLSKSFTATAIGFAVQEGLLSLDDKVISFFDDKLPFAPCENMQKITIEDLLTMRSGHSVEPNAFQGEDYVANFLRSYVDLEPGTRFVYNTPATYMLSAIIQKVTGEKTVDYLTPRLFKPLGIETPFWESCPKGISMGGTGLYLKTEDIARFGTMFLNKGMFYGTNIISPEWIELASSKHTDNYQTKDWGAGYCFQMWRCVPDGVFRGDGAFGQFCLVLPKQDMVIAITSGTGYLQEILDIIWEELLPNISDSQIDKEEKSTEELQQYLGQLTLPLPQGERTNANLLKYSSVVYTLSQNSLGFKEISYNFEKENASITLATDDKTYYIKLGYGEWIENSEEVSLEEISCHNIKITNHIAAAGCFKGDSSYIAKLYLNTTPFSIDLKTDFYEDGPIISFSIDFDISGHTVNDIIYGRKK